jgi:hypothetical protein
MPMMTTMRLMRLDPIEKGRSQGKILVDPSVRVEPPPPATVVVIVHETNRASTWHNSLLRTLNWDEECGEMMYRQEPNPEWWEVWREIGHGIVHGHGRSMDALWPQHLDPTERYERWRLEDAVSLIVRADMGWSLAYSHLLLRTGWKKNTGGSQEDIVEGKNYWVGLDWRNRWEIDHLDTVVGGCSSLSGQ